MANPEHLEVVRQGADAIRQWRQAHPGQQLDLSCVDLSGTNLSETDLSRANLREAKLPSVKLVAACLPEANLSGAFLMSANLSNADLSGSNLAGANLSCANLSRANLSCANLSRANLYQANLTDAHLHRANLSGALLLNTTLSGADMDKADLSQAILSVDGHVEKSILPTDPKNIQRCRRRWQERLCDWESLRRFGNLPLFAISYAALLLVPLYIYAVAVYNQKVALARYWADEVEQRAADSQGGDLRAKAARLNERASALQKKAKAPGLGGEIAGLAGEVSGTAAALAEKAAKVEQADQTLAHAVQERLHQARVGWRTWLAFYSTILLAVAATIYRLGCPTRIQEFSSTVWCDQLGKPLIHYWPLSWQYRWLRLPCMGCYLAGGVMAGLLIVVKVWDVFWLIRQYA